jgi:hypothetical protein
MIILKDGATVTSDSKVYKVKGNYKVIPVEFRNSELLFQFGDVKGTASYRDIEIENNDDKQYVHSTDLLVENVTE